MFQSRLVSSSRKWTGAQRKTEETSWIDKNAKTEQEQYPVGLTFTPLPPFISVVLLPQNLSINYSIDLVIRRLFSLKFMNHFPWRCSLSLSPQAPVNGDTPPAEGLSENDSGVELTNENSPLTAAEPPSPFSPKQNGDAASPQGKVCSDWLKRRWWCGATFYLKRLKKIERE